MFVEILVTEVQNRVDRIGRTTSSTQSFLVQTGKDLELFSGLSQG